MILCHTFRPHRRREETQRVNSVRTLDAFLGGVFEGRSTRLSLSGNPDPVGSVKIEDPYVTLDEKVAVCPGELVAKNVNGKVVASAQALGVKHCREATGKIKLTDLLLGFVEHGVFAGKKMSRADKRTFAGLAKSVGVHLDVRRLKAAMDETTFVNNIEHRRLPQLIARKKKRRMSTNLKLEIAKLLAGTTRNENAFLGALVVRLRVACIAS